MTVLGVDVTLSTLRRRGQPRTYCVTKVDKGKSIFWVRQINDVLDRGVITGTEAEVMAGRFNFAACAVIGRPGFCRIRHLYSAVKCKSSAISGKLQAELHWWRQFLVSESSFRYAISPTSSEYVSIFTDAEGGGGIGAVMFKGRRQPVQISASLEKDFRDKFFRRKTDIIPLELGAVTAAAHRFKSDIIGNKVAFFIDNKSVMYSLKRGRCRAEDINSHLLHVVDLLSKTGAEVRFIWVPSKWNIADFPSRDVIIPGVERWHVRGSVSFVSSL
jgi:hypothetical protein